MILIEVTEDGHQYPSVFARWKTRAVRFPGVRPAVRAEDVLPVSARPAGWEYQDFLGTARGRAPVAVVFVASLGNHVNVGGRSLPLEDAVSSDTFTDRSARVRTRGTLQQEQAFWRHLRDLGFECDVDDEGRPLRPEPAAPTLTLNEAMERALDEHPDDWTARLAYADWLEEYARTDADRGYMRAQRWMVEQQDAPMLYGFERGSGRPMWRWPWQRPETLGRVFFTTRHAAEKALAEQLDTVIQFLAMLREQAKGS